MKSCVVTLDSPPKDRQVLLEDPRRLATLARTGLADSDAEPSFDRLTLLAAKFLGTPVALVSLVDGNRQFFKSCFGLPEPWASRRETSLSHSFCQHVVTSRQPLVINDARLDPLVKDNGAVLDLGVIAYLGIPMVIDGQVIGSFCAIDGAPRAWTNDDIETLTHLAESVVTEIRLRADREELSRQRAVAENAEQQFRTLAESIPQLVWMANPDGYVFWYNRRWYDYTGTTPEQTVGWGWQSVHDPIEFPKVLERWKLCISTGEPFDMVFPLRNKDGVFRSFLTRIMPVKAENGDVVRWFGTNTDITDAKRHEGELRDAQLRLANALSAGSVATWTWDIPNDRVVADTNLARLFSVSQEDAQGGPISSYLKAIHPDDVDRVSGIIGQAVASGTFYDEEYRIVQADGSARWVVARGNVERDREHRAVSLSGAVVDITERKRVDDALRVSQERYRTLFSSMDEGFCVIEMIYDGNGKPIDYRYLEVNPAFEQHTGWSDVIGKRVCELAPELEPYWLEAFASVARTGKPVRIENEARQVGERWYDVYATRLEATDDSKVALIFSDITGRKRAEKEREELVEQLSRADQRKDEFLAILAHELRNPLGVISNGVQLAEMVKTPQQLGEVREIIQQQVSHLNRLIDDLLDVSRISQGKVALNKEIVQLADVVSRALHLVQPLVEEKRHKMTVALPQTPVRFLADPTRIQQILGNLLTNAAKYTDSNGAIHVSAVVENDEIVFRVHDTGVGISAEMLPKVFGLFTQVDASLHRSQGGLGIGLTLVRTLVEMHGGSITAVSEGKGCGSEFTVRMPIGEVTADTTNAPADDAIHPIPVVGRILVVDDNRDTANTTAVLLSHRGYQVQTARNGHDALEIARRTRPHVILLDIGLPGMNGYEVASRLRDDVDCKESVLIAVSGYADDKARERSKACGFHQHLTKPLNFPDLYKTIAFLVPPAADVESRTSPIS